MAQRARGAPKALQGASLPIPAVAEALGVGVRTLRRRIAEGVLVPARPGVGRNPALFDVIAVARVLLNRPDSPRDDRDRSQAELNRLRLSRERGLLLPRDQVIAEGSAYVAATSARIRALGPRLVGSGLVASSAEGKLAELLEDVLIEMSRWRTAIEISKAAGA